ncbi:hypothetical protein N8H71_00985 [Pseudomonas koreensis]|uniref:hypothetical protein n=1 Tax=Pseudomonas koreensis TaxID=198620 RepID=UPI0021C5FDF2|nr:hypothetical protein [Pseudomonas koreensis]MCU0070140.1 hypothetical protein [Pseudomonas koreensis]
MSMRVESASDIVWNMVRILARVDFFEEEQQKAFEEVLKPFLILLGAQKKCYGAFVSMSVVDGLKAQGLERLCYVALDFDEEVSVVSSRRKTALQDIAILTGGQAIFEDLGLRS